LGTSLLISHSLVIDLNFLFLPFVSLSSLRLASLRLAVSVTPLWALAGTSGEHPILPPIFLVRRQAYATPAVFSVTVAAVEVAWILRGAIRSRMIGVVAVVSSVPDL
jgi:hypothetical protein